ncbi:hypothetical protein BU26DRAFT_291794 [Trematosphaeria pertusa]|uniref:Uncharacterized protein n=1 Tax=Trematosphaeria pertusa TaxID=390896 RepID=A0A6A6IGZ9_9PLEO|nr:uncharacterized protein BU26DRAFT_291794 [Trematosphaeria pertusa]KAF2249885.1 hypothetical protein BU26DRAFT_291794 [Trematosphaeria pertusa]
MAVIGLVCKAVRTSVFHAGTLNRHPRPPSRLRKNRTDFQTTVTLSVGFRPSGRPYDVNRSWRYVARGGRPQRGPERIASSLCDITCALYSSSTRWRLCRLNAPRRRIQRFWSAVGARAPETGERCDLTCDVQTRTPSERATSAVSFVKLETVLPCPACVLVQTSTPLVVR